jgi:hypothetical protein
MPTMIGAIGVSACLDGMAEALGTSRAAAIARQTLVSMTIAGLALINCGMYFIGKAPVKHTVDAVVEAIEEFVGTRTHALIVLDQLPGDGREHFPLLKLRQQSLQHDSYIIYLETLLLHVGESYPTTGIVQFDVAYRDSYLRPQIAELPAEPFGEVWVLSLPVADTKSRLNIRGMSIGTIESIPYGAGSLEAVQLLSTPDAHAPPAHSGAG